MKKILLIITMLTITTNLFTKASEKQKVLEKVITELNKIKMPKISAKKILLDAHFKVYGVEYKLDVESDNIHYIILKTKPRKETGKTITDIKSFIDLTIYLNEKVITFNHTDLSNKDLHQELNTLIKKILSLAIRRVIQTKKNKLRKQRKISKEEKELALKAHLEKEKKLQETPEEKKLPTPNKQETLNNTIILLDKYPDIDIEIIPHAQNLIIASPAGTLLRKDSHISSIHAEFDKKTNALKILKIYLPADNSPLIFTPQDLNNQKLSKSLQAVIKKLLDHKYKIPTKYRY